MAKKTQKKAKKNDPYEYGDNYNFVPEKKKSGILSKILIVIFFLIFAVSGGMLLNELVIKPYFSDKALGDIQKELESDMQEEESEESTWEVERDDGTKETVKVNDTVRAVNKLKKDYPDIVGWIKIPSTEIHFPVVQSSLEDPEHYLYRNYRDEDTEYGSIFLDAASNVDGFNQIIHGHSMLDGRMFYNLIDFGKLDVYKKSPVVNYDTYKEAGQWKIVSVYRTNTYPGQGEIFDYFQHDFDSSADKMEYIYQVMQRSIIDTGVNIKDTDRFISLSTCSYELEGFRTVVVARKVRDGESAEVDVSKAALRGDDTLYPDAWYDTYGGTKPEYPEYFLDAQKEGITPWYKGDN